MLGEGGYHETLSPQISGSADAPITIAAAKPGAAILALGGSLPVGVEILNASFPPMPKITSDYNLFYLPPGVKGTIGELPGVSHSADLSAWQAAPGPDLHSLRAEPLFVDPAKRDFRLKDGSPGKGAAPGGEDIGIRWK